MRKAIFMTAILLSPLALSSAMNAQTIPKKPPVLIRDTGVAEGKADPKSEVKKEYNPLLAEENLKIGNFYFKQKNYVAAIDRYKEAIEFQPNLIEAHEALARAYEKAGDLDKAIATYTDFLKNFPDSSKASDFRSRIEELEKKKKST